MGLTCNLWARWAFVMGWPLILSVTRSSKVAA
jgi:hypothetical protein